MCVLIIVVFERIMYYGILVNFFIFFMNDIEFSLFVFVGFVFVFIGMVWMMLIVGGIVGDFYSGCYNVVWGSFFIYIVGVCVILGLIYFSCGSKNCFLDCKILVVFVLIVVFIGEGVYKVNVIVFGGD